jgi:hypothetical protein
VLRNAYSNYSMCTSRTEPIASVEGTWVLSLKISSKRRTVKVERGSECWMTLSWNYQKITSSTLKWKLPMADYLWINGSKNGTNLT